VPHYTAAGHEPDMKNSIRLDWWQTSWKFQPRAASPVPDAERNSPAASRDRAGVQRKPRACRCRSTARIACAGIVCARRRQRRLQRTRN